MVFCEQNLKSFIEQEQAVFPLRQKFAGSFSAVFRLECDGPILLQTLPPESPELEPSFLVPERLIYQLNSEKREKEVKSLVESSEYLIYYSHVLDFDVIFEANRKKQKIAFVTLPDNRSKISEFSRRSSLVSKLTLPNTLAEAILYAPDSAGPIPLRVNFLTTDGLIDFGLLESYCNFSFFSQISPHDLTSIETRLKIRIKFQLIYSEWVSKRVLLNDKNIPLDMNFADIVNMIQLPSYPVFLKLINKKL